MERQGVVVVDDDAWRQLRLEGGSRVEIDKAAVIESDDPFGLLKLLLLLFLLLPSLYL